MTESAGVDGIRTSGSRAPHSALGVRSAYTATAIVDPARAARRDDRISRTVLGSAIAAVAVLVLLMPTTPLVGGVLMAAICLGVVAALVGRAEDRRSTGDTLERLTTQGYLVFVDRVAPALTGTIGHLVIGPGGVFVIETRDDAGRVRIRGDMLIVGRHSHSVASHLRAQVAAVATTLEPLLDGSRASVVPLICMRHAELPIMHRTVAGIPLLRESQLERRIARSARVLDEATVVHLGELVDQTMPEAVRRRVPVPAMSVPDRTTEPEASSWSSEPIAYAQDSMAMSAGMAIHSTQG